ncbi:MAG: LysM peptidoglycan-binding domain-containing protein [Candidatus Promineifilaceae bacterium]|nr:LysM peptidoglycan-binding domain-containing protein [Candidatus Promineifilaceae bacterium]
MTDVEPAISEEVPEQTQAASAPEAVREPAPETVQPEKVAAEGAPPAAAVEAPAERSPVSPEVEPVLPQPSRALFWLTLVAAVLIAGIGSLVVQHAGPQELALIPTATPLQPTATFTPTATAAPTTSTPEVSPSATPLPSPTITPQPPRSHEVREGETLFGLSLLYNVTMDSIAALNQFDPQSPIQSGSELQIPWPTPTPPLVPLVLEINGETVIADPTGCERYEIQEGDAMSQIAARYQINFTILQQVNRLTEQSILRPGDTLCIPEITYGGILPPTPGPSPTPAGTLVAGGPTLLYPRDGAAFDMEDEPLLLQWVAVKDLASDEWYMVEVIDTSELGAHPFRGFTRENAFRLPEAWRPDRPTYHPFEWRVAIVRVVDQRADGGFIYTFGGEQSATRAFTWMGAVPTPTPTNTPTATPSPVP